jgi:DNA polymerase IV (DinB-like DNA polymerase)
VRVIGHLDIDYFYAQVEELSNPNLRNKPVVVCVFSGRSESSGVVSTSNYIARQYGVKSGMPIIKAKKLLSSADAQFIPLDMEKYSTISEKVMRIVEEETGSLEVMSIDEAYFDITDLTKGVFPSSKEVAQRLKDRILTETGLTTSVGIGPTKATAKIASDLAKPGGLVIIDEAGVKKFLEELPIEKLPGVGPRTKNVLNNLGIFKVGELARADMISLSRSLGKKTALKIYRMANASDEDIIVPETKPTQISRIITLKVDTLDEKKILKELQNTFEEIQDRIDSSGFSFRSITAISITSQMKIHTKSKTYSFYINNLKDVKDDVEKLFKELCKSTVTPIRRAGLRISELKEIHRQESMLTYIDKRIESISQ